MKFLLDAQLPVSLKSTFRDFGFECLHTLDLPDKNLTKDAFILDFVEKENFILVTKDNDFLVSHLINNNPVKLLYIKTGNIKNNELKELLKQHLVKISDLLEENNFIQLTQLGIVIHNL